MQRLPSWCRDAVLLDGAAPLPVDRPFTAREADAEGVPSSLRHKLVARGLLRPMVRGVFVATQVPDSLRLRVAALALVTPPHVVVVDRTAAWLHGVDALPRSAMELGGVVVTTPLRTACDLGRLLWRYDALAAIDGFLRLGVAQDELVAEIDRFKGRRGVVQLWRLAALGDRGAESPPESALRLHWHEADIPEWPTTQI